MIGNAPGHRAHDLESIKRRHARASFGRFDARERRVEPVRRSANREAQEEPLELGSISLQ